jgi:hypothetical protein
MPPIPFRRRVTAASLATGTLIAMLVVILTQSPAGAEGAATQPGYLFYASCSPDGIRHTETTHVCQQGDRIRAVLRYSESPVDYRVCLSYGGRATSCGELRHLTPGRSAITTVGTKDFAGLITVSWRVGSVEVGSTGMRFVEDPIVPSFGVSPLIVSGTHRLFGLVLRHVAPGLRVRAWRDCVGTCSLPIRLVSSVGENRRYRIVGPRMSATFSLGDFLLVQVDDLGRGPGAKLWGRLYRGKLVGDKDGGPGDTAIHRSGSTLCVPPGKTFRQAIDCAKVRAIGGLGKGLEIS